MIIRRLKNFISWSSTILTKLKRRCIIKISEFHENNDKCEVHMNFTVKRGVDKLGRIVIPKNMRDYYGIECGEDVVLVPTDDGLLIVKLTKEEEKILDTAKRAKLHRG